jgi:hypothetical protein
VVRNDGHKCHLPIFSAWNHEFRTLPSDISRLRMAHGIWLVIHRRPYFHAGWFTLQMPYMRGWMRSFEDVGLDEVDLTNYPQEIQISHPVTFSRGAGQRMRCTIQILAHWKNWKPGFGTLSPCPTQLPPEDCEFHPLPFEEICGPHKCLHWNLSYASILYNVHIQIISIILYCKHRIYNPFLLFMWEPPTMLNGRP